MMRDMDAILLDFSFFHSFGLGITRFLWALFPCPKPRLGAHSDGRCGHSRRNHSENIPIDGMMLWHDVLPVLLRVLYAGLPIILFQLFLLSGLFLLGNGGWIAMFVNYLRPENCSWSFRRGLRGSSTFFRRIIYKRFRVGHAELAIEPYQWFR